MDLSYMENVMWAFAQLHKKGLVYEDHRVMPYSWAMQTPVSNHKTEHEAALLVGLPQDVRLCPEPKPSIRFAINTLRYFAAT